MSSQLEDVKSLSSQDLILHAQALAALDDAVMITDKDAAIVWVNPAFTKLTGYTLEEVRGKNPRILNSGRHTKEFFENLYRTIQAKRVFKSEMIDRRKDGACFTMENAISPITDAEGNITHYVSRMT